MKKVRAIWINAEERRVEEVQLALEPDGSGAEAARKLVGGWLGQGGRFDSRNLLLVDDDGRLKSIGFGFTLEGAQVDYYVGNGIIMGYDAEGETIPTTIKLEEVRAKCAWVDLRTVTHMNPGWSVIPLDQRAVALAAELRHAGFASVADAIASGIVLPMETGLRVAVDRILAFWRSSN